MSGALEAKQTDRSEARRAKRTFTFYFYRFSIVEMKRIYRGFKTECPTGLITEEAFHGIYSRFFPQGGEFEPHFRHFKFHKKRITKKQSFVNKIHKKTF